MTAPPYQQSACLGACPGVLHGFFGRIATKAPSLDVSAKFGTSPRQAAENRRVALQAVAADGARLMLLSQRHTANVVRLTGQPSDDERPVADGIVTTLPRIALGIVTADCAPILFADPDAGVIGACHAGWRGAADGIVGHMIEAMTALGARTGNITAARPNHQLPQL